MKRTFENTLSTEDTDLCLAWMVMRKGSTFQGGWFPDWKE